MFWRATLAIAALYYVTVPAEDRRQTESEIRALAGHLPAQAIGLCQEKPLLCAEAARRAGAAMAPANPAESQPLPPPLPKAGDDRRLVEGVPLPPRRPGPHPARKGA